MDPAGWLLVLCMHGAPQNADLRAAERAYEEGRYQQVLPLLQQARASALPKAELERSLELDALTHAAFDQGGPAIEAFRYILGVNPSYLPAPSASPKLLSLFSEARRQGPLGLFPTVEPPPPPPAVAWLPDAGTAAPTAEGPALYQRWWFWAGIGVIAAGAGAGTWYAEHPIIPNGSLGVGQMK